MLEYSSLLLALAVGCGAMSLTLAVSWLANRRDGFLLVWAMSTFVFVGAIVGYGAYAADETSIPNVIPCVLLAVGMVICWGAACLFRSGALPLRAMLMMGSALSAVDVTLYFLDLDGVMYILANLSTAAFLAASAHQYWLARGEKLSSLSWLIGLYLVTAASFVSCAVMIAIETPLHLQGAPENWAEVLNAIICIFAVTGIGALSLAINQERLARDHRIESRTDALTGLLNRRALDELYGRARSPRSTAVIVFDLDHFKAINDLHGHALGDEVLRRFTAICQQVLRASDVAARIGGEEFAVVLPGSRSEDALRVAERIRTRFEGESVDWENATISCTVSAGVHGADDREEMLDALLREADKALYLAKNTGRNRVCGLDGQAVVA
ncbi:GGDEF domain-containing protein [Breoghania sp. L-A4]|uniref:GGDEF domain-containing protein n=1 Tax=Breoghania sp. L-A4 TaxID=2304600 RepID=UPI000E359317|nr:GGDEF domain-containing protein [Breoghania sp. L-A4]AXS39546.1 GGDEF domain-containing protein [Breoghania sp. L-A4]